MTDKKRRKNYHMSSNNGDHRGPSDEIDRIMGKKSKGYRRDRK